MECGQAKRLCPSALENGKEKALIFLGLSVLCAFQLSVILMRNNIHLLIKAFKSKIDGLCLRKSWFQLHPFYCPAWGTHSQCKKNYLYLECFSWSGVLINSHSKAVLLEENNIGTQQGKREKVKFYQKVKSPAGRTTPLRSLALLVEVCGLDATCLRREKQDPFIKVFSRKNVNLCQGAGI